MTRRAAVALACFPLWSMVAACGEPGAEPAGSATGDNGDAMTVAEGEMEEAGRLVRITRAEVRTLEVDGKEEMEAVRARVVGVFEEGGFADLTLFAFHGKGEWPLVIRVREPAPDGARTGFVRYSLEKTRYVEADRLPGQDRDISFPAASRRPGGRAMERRQGWRGDVRIEEVGEIGQRSVIRADLVFSDDAGSTRRISARVAASRTPSGRMPWKQSFGPVIRHEDE